MPLITHAFRFKKRKHLILNITCSCLPVSKHIWYILVAADIILDVNYLARSLNGYPDCGMESKRLPVLSVCILWVYGGLLFATM